MERLDPLLGLFVPRFDAERQFVLRQRLDHGPGLCIQVRGTYVLPDGLRLLFSFW